MPSKNRVGRHERGHLSQCGAAEPLPEHRETSPLRIVEPQTAWGQLCFQRAILLAKERDGITLLALEPPEQRGKEHLCRKHGSESTLMRPREFSDTTGVC
jgi:hypothetical protein